MVLNAVSGYRVGHLTHLLRQVQRRITLFGQSFVRSDRPLFRLINGD
jgi:hypothetical protein